MNLETILATLLMVFLLGVGLWYLEKERHD